MKRKADHGEPDGGQLLFTYRRTVAERLASGELRDVTREARAAGFRWPLAVTRRLWEEVEAVPGAHRRTETPKARWQHLFLLAAPAAARMQREGGRSGEVNVVLRTTDAPRAQPRAHEDLGIAAGRPGRRANPSGLYPRRQRRMKAYPLLPLAFQTGAGGRRPGKCYLGRRFSVFPFMSSGSSASNADDTTGHEDSAAPAPADTDPRTVHPLVVRLVEYRQRKNWTQEQAAARLKIPLNTLRGYECGNRNPGGANTEKILALIGWPKSKAR